jgi:predicted DNA-binding transcriptional regulator AlpA
MKTSRSGQRPQPPRIRTVAVSTPQNEPPAVKINQPSRLVFKPEVLDRVGVTYPAIWQWMREGKFPASREVGGKVAWLESEIDEWIASRPIRRYKAMEGA